MCVLAGFEDAVWRRIQKLGLAFAYCKRGAVFKLCRCLMALPFLPATHIQPAFQKLCSKVADPNLKKLIRYIEKTWITSTTYPVASWCVFNQPTRTNNDVEGWHRRLNKKAQDQTPAFYELVPLLHKEANQLPVQVKLVSEGKLSRYQRQQHRSNQAIVFNLWDQYLNGHVSTTQLLTKCGRVNGPVLDFSLDC